MNMGSARRFQFSENNSTDMRRRTWSQSLKSFCCKLPTKTTSTAQYAAVAANTSCLLAVVHMEIAVAKAKANVSVIDAIALVDSGTDENM